MIGQVDLSVWDMATSCGSCHVGGSIIEQDLGGTRLSQRPAVTDGSVNAIDHYVSDDFVPSTGLPNFTVQPAPWKYLQPYDMDQDGTVGAGEGFMMPNVRELDCFMCHFEGFNNVLNSAAIQMGYLNAAPSLSSGMMNMFTGSYVPGTVTLGTAGAMGAPASITGNFLNRLKPEPPTANCQQCHIPSNMANFNDMFEVFLSASPMEYNPDGPYASPFTGKAMPSFDINAAFVPQGSTSPQVVFDFYAMEWQYLDGSSAAGPFGLFPMALDSSWSMFDETGAPNTAVAGGDKPGMSGPLYYAGSGDPSTSTPPDQNAMKKSTIPFPKADWFKRGDLWEPKLEVHYSMGCGGCHYNGKSDNDDLNQCDPGRGQVRLGGIESEGNGTYDSATLDTRNTVKTCAGCHITGKSIAGNQIDTFGAPNPSAAHANAGLTAKVTTAVVLDGSGNETTALGDHLDVVDCATCHVYKPTMAVRALDCTSGKRFPTLIGIDNSKGMMGMFTDPMTADSMDDATAIGAVQQNMGNMGITAPAIDMMMGMTLYGADTMMANMTQDQQDWFYSIALVAGDAGCPSGYTCSGTWTTTPDVPNNIDNLMAMMPQYFPGMPAGSTNGDAARAMLKADLQEWKPIYGWHANAPKKLPDGSINPDWRRKIIPINFITAQLWDDSQDGGATDANGDGGEATTQTVSWDPWISRDMKAGMNFANTGFATVPTGFGLTPGTDPYYSAYDANGLFTGAFNYVGIYGGNIILTTPEEITGYKTHRADLATANPSNPGVNKSWEKTQLVFQGGNPFQVTHNIARTSVHVLGKSCGDCHSSESGFFSGQYDMTGTAVPASATYDYDASGYTFGLDMAAATGSNMMQRPVVDYEVVAVAADLRTGSEAKWKIAGTDHGGVARAGGYVDDVEFEELGCYADGVFTPYDGVTCTTQNYKRTTDLDKSKFMYPELHHDEAALAARIAELQAITKDAIIGDVNLGIVGGVTVTGASGNLHTQFTEGDTISVDDTTASNIMAGSLVYRYENIEDAASGVTQTGGTLNLSAGTYRVVAEATSVDGKTVKSISYIDVVAPLRGNTWITPYVTNLDVELTIATENLAGGATSYDYFKIYWDDEEGMTSHQRADVEAAGNKVSYTYAAGGTYQVSVLFFKDGSRIDTWYDTVTVP